MGASGGGGVLSVERKPTHHETLSLAGHDELEIKRRGERGGGSLSGKRLGQRRREERGWGGLKRQHDMGRKKREEGK